MVYSKMCSLAMGRLQTGRTSVLYMASNDRYLELQVAEATKAEWESVVRATRTLYSLNMGTLSAASTLYALTTPPGRPAQQRCALLAWGAEAKAYRSIPLLGLAAATAWWCAGCRGWPHEHAPKSAQDLIAVSRDAGGIGHRLRCCVDPTVSASGGRTAERRGHPYRGWVWTE
jgi:hypothetical protein